MDVEHASSAYPESTGEREIGNKRAFLDADEQPLRGGEPPAARSDDTNGPQKRSRTHSATFQRNSSTSTEKRDVTAVKGQHPQAAFVALCFAKLRGRITSLFDELQVARLTLAENERKLIHYIEVSKAKEVPPLVDATRNAEYERYTQERRLLEEANRKLSAERDGLRQVLVEAQAKLRAKDEQIETLKLSNCDAIARLADKERQVATMNSSVVRNESLMEAFEQNFSCVKKEVEEYKLAFGIEQEAVRALKALHRDLLEAHKAINDHLRRSTDACHSKDQQISSLTEKAIELEAAIKEQKNQLRSFQIELKQGSAQLRQEKERNGALQVEKQEILVAYEKAQRLLVEATQQLSAKERRIAEEHDRNETLAQELERMRLAESSDKNLTNDSTVELVQSPM